MSTPGNTTAQMAKPKGDESSKEKKPKKRAEKPEKKVEKKRPSPSQSIEYGVNIHRLLGKVVGDKQITISKHSVELLSKIITHLETRITDMALDTCQYVDKKNTLSPHHVKAAIKIVMPRDLASVANEYATNATNRYIE
jgi:hypothetical protein